MQVMGDGGPGEFVHFIEINANSEGAIGFRNEDIQTCFVGHWDFGKMPH